MADTEKTTERAARDIVGMMGYKALFEYMPEMEISVPDSDKRNSLDKIAYYYRNEEIVLSDLYIGYVIALYKYTIPKVVAETIQALGSFWPQKRVPRYIDRDALLSRIRRCAVWGCYAGLSTQRKETISSCIPQRLSSARSYIRR